MDIKKPKPRKPAKRPPVKAGASRPKPKKPVNEPVLNKKDIDEALDSINKHDHGLNRGAHHRKNRIKRQGLYMFDHTLYYNIYDNYKAGHYAQVLLSPDNDLPDWLVEELIEVARVDFNQLLHTRPVPVLDTQEWRRRLGSEPIGKDGKQPIHKM